MKLSVVFITYNHGAYVKEALEGMVNQRTDFDFEILCRDDCSTDNTQEIIRGYAEKYPNKFRLFFNEKNTGRPTKNVYDTAMEARGEYLAFLEGDDYWTDMDKLQKQVDFLDSHRDYMGTTHSFKLIGETGEPIENERLSKLYDWSGDYTWDDWRVQGAQWPGQTASNVCRSFFRNGKLDYTILYRAHDFIDDGLIFTFILLQGKIYRFDDIMAAHRYVEKAGGESWNSIKLRRNYMIEEAQLKLEMMKWCEDNVGLTEFGYRRAKDELKTAVSIFVKAPSAVSWKLCREAIGYYFIHLKFGKVKKQ